MQYKINLNTKRLVTVAVLFISAAPLLLAAATQSQARPSSGKIAYTAFEGQYPAWPASGTNGDIYAMNADGSGKTQLTDNPAWDIHPEWSPNGRKIAFVSYRDNPDPDAGIEISEIYVMNADGSDQTRLTTGALVTPWFSGLSWSPNGKKIAFSSATGEGEDVNVDIYTVNARDGSDRTRLTDSPGFDAQPDFSPNGKRIAFRSSSSDPDDPFGQNGGNIYDMKASDGSDLRQLTETVAPAGDMQPDYSPNGRKIAFTSTRDGRYEVYRMNADGSNEEDVTNPANSLGEFNVWPDWSPNGRQIAFHAKVVNSCDPDGSREIITMNADGSGQQNVTQTPGIDELWPSWHQGSYHPLTTPLTTKEEAPVKDDGLLDLGS